MANILRIYDFELNHKEKKKNVTFYNFCLDHPELKVLASTKGVDSNKIQWKIVLDAFKVKFSNDLNTEKLKNTRTQKIVKRGLEVDRNKKFKRKDILIDSEDLILFSNLQGGKITDKSVLEKITLDKDNPTLEQLNGDRIYDEMFFLIHLSFRSNKARLFTLTRKNNLNLDTIIKSYFEKNMFKCPEYQSGKWHPFVPKEIQSEALKRTVINNIAISKNQNLNSDSLEDEFEIEIKLKSKKKGGFNKITKKMVDMLKKTQVTIDKTTVESEGGEVKFNITDPETKTNKSIVFGNADDFIPRLSYEDKDILNSDLTLDEKKLKKICLKYIQYDETGLI